MTRWYDLTGGQSGEEYAAQVDATAAACDNPHGESTFVRARLGERARILDAGCGTGRVGIHLAEHGHEVMGVDADESMLAVARKRGPGQRWLHADLSTLDLAEEPTFDVVVLAGNVIPLLAPGTLDQTVHRLASLLHPGGLLFAGFGLDEAHLPRGCPVTSIGEYDAAFARTDLFLRERYATWWDEPWAPTESTYAVSVHERLETLL